VKFIVTDGGDNSISFEKKINGVFGGFLDFLGDIWNVIAGAVTAAVNAVIEALNAIWNYIKELITSTINTLLAPILSAIDSWAKSVQQVIDEVFAEHSASLAESDPAAAAQKVFDVMFGGTFNLILLALVVGLEAFFITLGALVIIFTGGAGSMLGYTLDAIVSAIITVAVSAVAIVCMEAIARAILYMAIPEGDEFWESHVGSTFMPLAGSIASMIMNKFAIGSMWDAGGLLVCFTGFIASTLIPGITGALIGVLCAGIGFAITLKKDPLDYSPLPFKWFEEILGATCFGYSIWKVGEEL